MSDPTAILEKYIDTDEPLTTVEMRVVMDHAREIGATPIYGKENAVPGLLAHCRVKANQWTIEEAPALLERMKQRA